MPVVRPPQSNRSVLLLLATAGTAGIALIGLAFFGGPDRSGAEEPEMKPIPDRFVEIMPASPSSQKDGEKRDEPEFALEQARAGVPAEPTGSRTGKEAATERQAAPDGQFGAAPTAAGESDLGEIAGLAGILGSTSETSMGGSGLGTLGSGLGAGGLGTKGIGSGGSGYGRASGYSVGSGSSGTRVTKSPPSASGGSPGFSYGGVAMSASGAAAAGAAAIAPAPLTRGVEDGVPASRPDVNGFERVSVDALSTFAIDVDTASYTQARRTLRDGYLPPISRVRVEEFVNFFPYEYDAPKRGVPFAVDFEAAPSPFAVDRTLVRVGVQGKKVARDERKPVHLTFLVDVSGSMQSSDKIDLVKASLRMLTEELEDGDTIALVTYAGRTDLVLPATSVSKKRQILAAIDRLTAGGSTAMGAGIDLAYEQADSVRVSGSVNRVILCSDGDANVGISNPELLSERIRGYAEKGVTLTTLGFGTGNYRDDMMERLANDGDGNYFYLDSIDESRRVLVDEMTSTMEVIAKDVKIQVQWHPGAVTAYRLVGYENRDVADDDFRDDKVDAGEIGAGHQVTAIYEVQLASAPTGPLATVRVRNKAPGEEAPAVERSYTLERTEIRTSFIEANSDFRLAVTAAMFAEVLRDSPHTDGVTLAQLQRLAAHAASPEFPVHQELVELISRARELRSGDVADASR